MSKSNKNLSIMEINQAAPKFQDTLIAPMHTAVHVLAKPTSKEKRANATIYFLHVRQRNKSSPLKRQ